MIPYSWIDSFIAEHGHLIWIALAHASIVVVVVLRIYFSRHPPRRRNLTILILPSPTRPPPEPAPPRLGPSLGP